MNWVAILTMFFNAQIQYGEYGNYGAQGEIGPADAFVVFLIGFFYVGLALFFYALDAFFRMRLFRKANVAGWKAWVPIYNMIKFMQLGGYHGAWILINLVPFVGVLVYLILNYIAAYRIGLKTDKEGIWVLLYIFVPFVWMGILGLDRSTWSERRSVPSVAPEISPA